MLLIYEQHDVAPSKQLLNTSQDLQACGNAGLH